MPPVQQKKVEREVNWMPTDKDDFDFSEPERPAVENKPKVIPPVPVVTPTQIEEILRDVEDL